MVELGNSGSHEGRGFDGSADVTRAGVADTEGASEDSGHEGNGAGGAVVEVIVDEDSEVNVVLLNGEENENKGFDGSTEEVVGGILAAKGLWGALGSVLLPKIDTEGCEEGTSGFAKGAGVGKKGFEGCEKGTSGFSKGAEG